MFPIEELDTLGFEAALSHCVDELLMMVSSDGFICFCVDDLIFIDSVDLRYVDKISSRVAKCLLSPCI